MAYKMYYMDDDVGLSRRLTFPKERYQEVDVFTIEETKAILTAAKTEPINIRLLIEIALFTGMRRGEILGLMWRDVDLRKGKIQVTHNLTIPTNGERCEVTTLLKSEAAYRELPMPLLLQKALTEAKKASKSLCVFSAVDGGNFQRKDYETMWREVSMRTTTEKYPVGSKRQNRKGGKPYPVLLDFHCHPHLLRHTYITQCFESGMDLKQVQYLAGHSSPDMTLRVYTHYRQKTREQETANQVCSATAYLDQNSAKMKAVGQD
jgi:integrase